MSSPKTKKVHYERGTKPGHSPRSPRSHDHDDEDLDSGLGSTSTSSTTASLGDAPTRYHNPNSSNPSHHQNPFTPQTITSQRTILSAVQEALDAANEKIRLLAAQNEKLNAALTESNKMNRVLKREMRELEEEVEAFRAEREQRREKKKDEREKERERERERERKEEKEREKRPSPPRRDREVDYIRPALERRMSSYGRDQRPVVSQPPMNPSQNPFTPISERVPPVTYPPSQKAYAPTPMPFAPGPIFSHQPQSPRATIPNDGRYHLTPI